MAKRGIKRTNWFPVSSMDSVSAYVDVYEMHDSSLIAYYIKDKNDVDTIIELNKEDSGEIDELYAPLINNYAIYFLMGSTKIDNKTYKTVYIGQASKRNNAKGLDRLHEHLARRKDGTPVDKYYNDWSSILYITDKNNQWSTAKIDTLEEIFIKAFEEYSERDACKILNSLDGHTGNISDQEFQLAVSLITELLSTSKFGFNLNSDVYTESIDSAIADMLEKMSREIKTEVKEEAKSELDEKKLKDLTWAEQVDKYDNFRELVSTSNNYIMYNGRMPSGESFSSTSDVLTPLRIAEEMVNMIPSELFSKGKKILNLYSKDGAFGVALIKRCVEDTTTPLYSQIPDKRERLDYAVQHMLYFTCNSLGSYLLTSKKLLDTIEQRIQEIYKYKPMRLRDYNINIPNVITINNIRLVIKTYKTKEMADLVANQLCNKYNVWDMTNNVEEDKNMKFDLVIGNPPYNNDLYIDFVYLAKALSSKYTCMITPAKWQGKGDNEKDNNGNFKNKNTRFRQDIIPYMKSIVFYPDTFEVFEDVREQSGITYYLIDNTICRDKNIRVICKANNNLEHIEESRQNILQTLYGSNISSIINKVFKSGQKPLSYNIGVKQSEYIENTNGGGIQGDIQVYAGEKLSGRVYKEDLKTAIDLDKYKVCTSVMPVDVGFDKNGQMFGLSKTYIIQPNSVPKGSFPVLKKFNTLGEAKSFQSYCNVRLIRFLYLIGICGKTISEEFWRFVPDPGKFDHIFTDEELYKKYNLTDEEINIIESVIKERK